MADIVWPGSRAERRIWCVHDVMAFPGRNGGLVPELA
jgi:hypothetical protein